MNYSSRCVNSGRMLMPRRQLSVSSAPNLCRVSAQRYTTSTDSCLGKTLAPNFPSSVRGVSTQQPPIARQARKPKGKQAARAAHKKYIRVPTMRMVATHPSTHPSISPLIHLTIHAPIRFDFDSTSPHPSHCYSMATHQSQVQDESTTCVHFHRATTKRPFALQLKYAHVFLLALAISWRQRMQSLN